MQTLSSAEKLKETMKERMKGNSIDSAEQPFVVLTEIKHNLVMCSGSAVLSVYAQALRAPLPRMEVREGGYSQSALLVWRWKRLRSS